MKTSKFKMTELGPIPEEWEVKPFSECFTLIRNNTYARECLTDHPGSVANVHYGDVLIKYGAVLDFAKNAVPYLKSDVKPNKDMLRDGDLVFADTAEDEAVGKAVEVQGLKSRMAVAGLHTVASRPHDGLFAPRYLGYYINSATYHNQLLPLITGTKVSSVSRAGFLATYVAIPPKGEQEKIAEALSDVDALLSAMTTLIEKKRAIKQGAMQELLTGKKRLVGFKNSESSCLCASVLKKEAGVVEGGFNTETQRRRGTEFKMTEIGLIPEDWEVKRLGECVDVYDGTHQTPCYVEHGVPFYSVENVTANNFINTKCISWKEHQMLTRRHKIEKGDVLMTRIGSIGVCRFVDWDVDASYYVSLALLKRKAKAEIDMEFLSFLSESDLFKGQVWQKSLQFAIPLKINLGPISDIKICIPPTLAEQRAIAEVLSDMDAEIEALEAKRAKYESIKQGMMQELLTGKTRLV